MSIMVSSKRLLPDRGGRSRIERDSDLLNFALKALTALREKETLPPAVAGTDAPRAGSSACPAPFEGRRMACQVNIRDK
jgi:di/tripeptidase